MSSTIDNFTQALNRELKLYTQEVKNQIDHEGEMSMKKLVEKTKATANVGKRKKHYRQSIKSRKKVSHRGAVTYQWYVAGSDYRLSHLLNNGHALRNGGRYEGTGFITKASEEIIEEYTRKVEEVLSNG